MRLSLLTTGVLLGFSALTALPTASFADTTVKIYMGQLYAPDADPNDADAKRLVDFAAGLVFVLPAGHVADRYNHTIRKITTRLHDR